MSVELHGGHQISPKLQFRAKARRTKASRAAPNTPVLDAGRQATMRKMVAITAGPSANAAHTAASIVHFYHTRDVLPRCGHSDPGEGTACWPASESADNMNTKLVGRLGLSDEEEKALVSFTQTLTDGFMHSDQR